MKTAWGEIEDIILFLQFLFKIKYVWHRHFCNKKGFVWLSLLGKFIHEIWTELMETIYSENVC